MMLPHIEKMQDARFKILEGVGALEAYLAADSGCAQNLLVLNKTATDSVAVCFSSLRLQLAL